MLCYVEEYRYLERTVVEYFSYTLDILMNAWIRTLEHVLSMMIELLAPCMWTPCTYIDSNAIERVFDAIKMDSDCLS